MTKESVLGPDVGKEEPESFQSAADELVAEVFTLQKAKWYRKEGSTTSSSMEEVVGVRHLPCLTRGAFHVIII